MHLEIGIAALAAFLWGAVLAGATGRFALSGPIFFLGLGVALGPAGAGVVGLGREGLMAMAQYALALVLFMDAANADFGTLKRHLAIPERLLGLALPLTVLAGAVAAWALLPGVGLVEALLVGAIVAPTDAALGETVVADERVPARLREGLKFESGLNDGLVTPVVLILLAAAESGVHGLPGLAVRLTIEEIGIGVAAGATIGAAGAFAMRVARRRGWRKGGWHYASTAMLGVAAFALTDVLGGAGFIGAFTGGLLYGRCRGVERGALAEAGEIGTVFSLMTWLVFGAALVGPMGHNIDWRTAAFAALALTAVRMLPVWFGFAGSGAGMRERLFLGWFGPRGLASVVFALMIVDRGLPHEGSLLAAVSCTIVASVVAHGVSAHFAARLARPTGASTGGTAGSGPTG